MSELHGDEEDQKEMYEISFFSQTNFVGFYQ